MMDKNYIVLLVLYFVLGCEAARILIVVPTPSLSHQIVFHPLAKELASRGHEVVMITTNPAYPIGQSPTNLTEIDIHDLSYGLRSEIMSKYRPEDDLYDQMKFFYKLFCKCVEVIFESAEIQMLLKNNNKHFDLLMIETITGSGLIFSHFFKAPVISVSSFGMMLGTNFASGAPEHPLLYPSIFHRKMYNLTLWDKVIELWNHIKHDYLFSYYENIQDEMLRNLFGPDVPTMQELSKNIDMFFLYTYPVWADNQPVPPNIVYFAGIHQKPKEDLPKDLKSYMDSSENGVIYMSLGTNVQPSQLGEQKTRMFMDVFSKLPYDILLKWDKEYIHGCPKNVKVVRWTPQSDVLRHPAVKLFITQAGLQSTDEAINAGVPLIGLPILGDQFYNAEKYLKHKIGLNLDIYTVNAEELRQAIKTVIEDESYRENVIRLRSIINDEAQPPLERAVWWTEYVLRHGGAKHLRAPAAHMSWAEYYELKLVVFLITSFTTGLVVISVCFFYFIQFILKNFGIKKIKIS